MLFLLNATALFWSSNKEEAGRPLGRPLHNYTHSELFVHFILFASASSFSMSI